MGVPRADGSKIEEDPRKIWRLFAENFFLLRATPSAMWLEHAFQEVFGIVDPLSKDNADEIPKGSKNKTVKTLDVSIKPNRSLAELK